MSFPLPPKPRRRLADFDVDPEASGLWNHFRHQERFRVGTCSWESKVIGDGSLALVRVAQEKASGKRYALKAGS